MSGRICAREGCEEVVEGRPNKRYCCVRHRDAQRTANYYRTEKGREYRRRYQIRTKALKVEYDRDRYARLKAAAIAPAATDRPPV